jgi:hypothetical protein
MGDYKVYYGEYTLKHWIDMILHRDIELPSFQRDFVWGEEKVIKLIESIQEKHFIPPVIIGTYFDTSNNDKCFNYVLDGQQRLSAIILAYLNKFPNDSKFVQTIDDEFADSNDDHRDEDDIKKNILKWGFGEIQDLNIYNRNELLLKLDSESYKDINWPTDMSSFNSVYKSDFFENNYLGFSYIKPTEKDIKEQKKYFSSVFRNINISSTQLSVIESRSSLYWLDIYYKDFFAPKYFEFIKVDNKKIDFARCLSLLFEKYTIVNKNVWEEQNNTYLAKGYGGRIKNMENYIIDFIYHVIGENPSPIFIDFISVFPENKYQNRIENLEKTFNTLELPKDYSSIIDADYYLCGLIYFVLLKGKNVKTEQKEELKKKIDESAQMARDGDDGERHIKTPGALKWIQKRVSESIKIYNNFLE